GNDRETAAILEKNGAQHIECVASTCVVDKINKVVSTPAYMLARSVNEVATGIECLVKELLALIVP
ncbi:MAG: isoprenoid biosynthesis protein ElbB, partial [Rickettsiella sp.]|nr:isoprenoid biosynthesis protein ElbB [Rickettsiella sp.]